MNRFFVGQRVRKSHGLVCVGIEGVVTSVDAPEFPYDICVAITKGGGRCQRLGEPVVPGDVLLAFADHWEPILPEGAAPSEFATLSDLLRNLEGVRA